MIFLNYNRVFVYENSNDTWSILQELLPADTTDVSDFGNSISITENKIAVGAKRSQFHAFIYAFDGTQYSESQRLSVDPDVYSDFWAYWHAFTLELQSDNLIIGCDGVNMCTYFLTLFYKNVNNSYQLQSYDEDTACRNISAENDIAVLSGKWHGDEPGPGEYRSGAYSYNGSIWEPDNTFSDGASMENIDWYSNIRNSRVVGIEGTDLHLLENNGTDWSKLSSVSVSEGLLSSILPHKIQLNANSIMSGDLNSRIFLTYSLKDTTLTQHCLIQTADDERVLPLDNSFICHTGDSLTIQTIPLLSANFIAETIPIESRYGFRLQNASIGDYSIEWDFDNDGSIDSYQQNPVFEMVNTDEMDVCLTVYDETGNDSHSIVKTITLDCEIIGDYARMDFYDWLSTANGDVGYFNFAKRINANSDIIAAAYDWNSDMGSGEGLKIFSKANNWSPIDADILPLFENNQVTTVISESKIVIQEQGFGFRNTYLESSENGLIELCTEQPEPYFNHRIIYSDITDNYSISFLNDYGINTLLFWGEWQDSLFVETQQTTLNGRFRDAKINDNYCVISVGDSLHVFERSGNTWERQQSFSNLEFLPQNSLGGSLGCKIVDNDNEFVVIQYVDSLVSVENLEIDRNINLLFFNKTSGAWALEGDITIATTDDSTQPWDVGFDLENNYLAHQNPDEDVVRLYYRTNNEWELIEELTNPEQPFDSGFGNQIVITDEDILISAPTQQLYDSQGALYVFPLDRLYVSNDDNEVSAPDLEGCLANYPNPFNPSTTFAYSIPESGDVEIAVYNLKGQKVTSLVNDHLDQGSHRILWEGKDSNNKNVSSGVYFYQLKLNGKALKTSKCVLLK